MLLSALCAATQDAQMRGDDVQIAGVTIDSRKVGEGELFFCLPGMRVDGHAYAEKAVAAGAVALVVERWLDEIGVPQILVKDARAACSYMAQAFYGYPARELTMVGATGTKGKTTTCFLIKAVADAAGRKCGLIGTAVNMIGSEIVTEHMSTPTTPDSIELQRLLRRMVDEGCTMCVMEVSAHATLFKRVEGMTFAAGIFTNFTQDHLDDFSTMDNYFASKLRFFEDGFCQWAAVNADAAKAEEVASAGMVCTRFGVSQPADVYAREIEIREGGVSFQLSWGGLLMPLHLQLSGLFNVYNAMAAATVCLHLGISSETVKRGLEGVRAVPGRMEAIETGTPYRVILDYAHSPDSLRNILEAIRQFTKGRVIALFGCGGDRDRAKRPIMGEIAGRLADLVIVTSDNPRGEEPMDIIRQITEGIEPDGASCEVIEDRRSAIAYALSIARAGDTVLLAGKGQETYQEIKGVKRPFDEKQIVAELLSK